MEQIVFPVPNICEYLTEESKMRVFTTTERDDQGSKVNDFFQQFDNLYNEMRWQKKIRSTSLDSESSSWKNNECWWILMVVVTGYNWWLVRGCTLPWPHVSWIKGSAVTVCFFFQILTVPVLFVQKIRLCSGSPVTSLFGGASPSTWPVWSTSLWLFSTLLAMMEMRVSVSFFFLQHMLMLLKASLTSTAFYLFPVSGETYTVDVRVAYILSPFKFKVKLSLK